MDIFFDIKNLSFTFVPYKSNIKKRGAYQYLSSNIKVLSSAFKAISKHTDITKSCLLDIGCGKGKILIYASKFNPKFLYGIEFDQILIDICKKNLKRNNINAFLINNDASIVNIPFDVNIIYINNPFDGKILSKVIKNIENSITKNPRDFFVLYQNPYHQEEFKKSNNFKEIENLKHKEKTEWILYRNIL